MIVALGMLYEIGIWSGLDRADELLDLPFGFEVIASARSASVTKFRRTSVHKWLITRIYTI